MSGELIPPVTDQKIRVLVCTWCTERNGHRTTRQHLSHWTRRKRWWECVNCGHRVEDSIAVETMSNSG